MADYWQLEESADQWLLEDSSGLWELEESGAAGPVPPILAVMAPLIPAARGRY
mgnify:CR=1 FL=1